MPSDIDPFKVRQYYKPLRVVDVCDALDGIGYFNIGLVSPEIRPLWLGMRFWGVAFTVRAVPANRPMWPLETTDEVVKAHGIWFERMGHTAQRFSDRIRAGHVVVMDTGGADTVGFWGSENAMGAVRAGAVGIITSGACRDTGELTLQKTPICSKGRGRTIIPGRIEVIETQTPIGLGGAQIRPGDIVGCDDDGIVVVPLDVAQAVASHARAILLADMRSRRRHYEALGLPLDSTVDDETVVRYFQQLERTIS